MNSGGYISYQHYAMNAAFSVQRGEVWNGRPILQHGVFIACHRVAKRTATEIRTGMKKVG